VKRVAKIFSYRPLSSTAHHLNSETLLLAVIASIPIQLNKFFFPSFSFVLGIPIDYRAPSIYLSDILILALFALSLKNAKGFIKFLKGKKDYLFSLLLFLFFIFLTSILTSVSKPASLIFSLKLTEMALFSLIAAYHLSHKSTLLKAIWVVKFSICWQSTLVVYQFIFQKSANLTLLGERSLDTSTAQIAHTQIFQTQFLRAYGTFPHPNVLGAFSAVALIFLLSTQSEMPKNAKRNPTHFWPLTQLFALITILLSFSKTALLILLLIPATKVKNNSHKILLVFVVFLAIYAYFKVFIQNSIDTIAERIILAQSSLDITRQNPLFGVGSNNFILAISKYNLTSISQVRLLQPVHNVFLLILAENGLLGLFLFTFVLLVLTKYLDNSYKGLLFLTLVIYLSVDHFLLTLQQGQLLFWFALAYIVSSPKKTTS
jgi:O-antigen ligase